MSIQKSPRVNYDEIAHLYDSQPFRSKEADPYFLSFLASRTDVDQASMTVLDMGCGTGNQLVANRAHFHEGKMIGLDRFNGMLQQAMPKVREISWIQADSAKPPFQDHSFDFISNQYSFHHVHDKAAMIHAVYRMLKPDGRFIMTNIDPYRMKNWLFYHYFPASLEADLQDFISEEEINQLMDHAGFRALDFNVENIQFAQDLSKLRDSVKRRDTCSQLITISDEAYAAGMEHLEQDIDRSDAPVKENRICVLTIEARK